MSAAAAAHAVVDRRAAAPMPTHGSPDSAATEVALPVAHAQSAARHDHERSQSSAWQCAHLKALSEAFMERRTHLVLVGFQSEKTSTNFRDRCIGAVLGVAILSITMLGPQEAMVTEIAGMANPASSITMLAWMWLFVSALLEALAIQLLLVSLLRAASSMVTVVDLERVAQQHWLKRAVCLACTASNLTVLCRSLRQTIDGSIFRDAPPAELMYIEVFRTLCNWLACASVSCLMYIECIRPRVCLCHTESSGTRELLACTCQEPTELGHGTGSRITRDMLRERAGEGGRKKCSSCCCCCCRSVSALVLVMLASIGTWLVSAPRNAGVINRGQPISEEQWEIMNNRDLVFCEMSMRMAQATANNKWGDNEGSGGITDGQAFHYRPEGAPDPYPNKYLATILETKILGSDLYTFPGEAFLSPRWTVLRIKYKPGHGGDDLVIVFRGSAGDPQNALDWTLFDALAEPSAVTQDDGMRFTKGFFDRSLCVLMQEGLFDVLRSNEAVGVSQVLAIGHSLGGAWASILMTRLAPGQTMVCPGDVKFTSPFGSLHAQAVTFGKPAPFYVAKDTPIPDIMRNLASRQTDYVFHADTIARADHGASKFCNEYCWQLLPWSSLPFLKAGQTIYIPHHYHGDTTAIWIVNDLTDKYAPMAFSKFPIASIEQIGVYVKEKDRWDGINLGFAIGQFIPSILAAGGEEHGNGYTYSMWKYRP
eukprot:TRINITY_DN29875_c0_g1_i1.p1 TRINITY_DN29875_c0_g1~~TRINITY_DN29875_c0_g1_i1.p1  ORF type:complete len:720 (+),score=63.88 TRINITY_DN29875_c0_g1_i1:35-2161(+)